MTRVFADTYFYLAILSPSDSAHERAIELSMELRASTVTTAWVLAEVADALARQSDRQRFISLFDRLRANSNVTIVPATVDHFSRGVELYRQRPDKDWSLTDCISFETMNELGLTDALTGDHHFEQAGFHILL